MLFKCVKIKMQFVGSIVQRGEIMDNNQLLQAISEMLDVKLDAKFDEKLAPINKRLDQMDERITNLENEVSSIKSTLENETNHHIHLIAECCYSTANKVEVMQKDIETLKADVSLLKGVTAIHTNQITNLALNKKQVL